MRRELLHPRRTHGLFRAVNLRKHCRQAGGNASVARGAYSTPSRSWAPTYGRGKSARGCTPSEGWAASSLTPGLKKRIPRTSLCTGELNAIRKHKGFLCSPFYGRACRWAILGELKPKGPKGPLPVRTRRARLGSPKRSFMSTFDLSLFRVRNPALNFHDAALLNIYV